MKIWNEILLIDKLRKEHKLTAEEYKICLLYTSDAADE